MHLQLQLKLDMIRWHWHEGLYYYIWLPNWQSEVSARHFASWRHPSILRSPAAAKRHLKGCGQHVPFSRAIAAIACLVIVHGEKATCFCLCRLIKTSSATSTCYATAGRTWQRIMTWERLKPGVQSTSTWDLATFLPMLLQAQIKFLTQCLI